MKDFDGVFMTMLMLVVAIALLVSGSSLFITACNRITESTQEEPAVAEEDIVAPDTSQLQPEAPAFEEDTGAETEVLPFKMSHITMSNPTTVPSAVAVFTPEDGVLVVDLDHEKLRQVVVRIKGKKALTFFNPNDPPTWSTVIGGVPVKVSGMTVEGGTAEITEDDGALTIRTKP